MDGDDTAAWLKDRFCAEPFTHFEILYDGAVAPCCSLWSRGRMGNVFRDGLEAVWNGGRARAIRRAILDGSFRHCRPEVCAEIVNRALPRRDDITDPVLRDVIDNGRETLDGPPGHIFLAEDTTCNLACPSCRDGIQCADPARRAELDKVAAGIVTPALAARRPIALSISGQGDPWASPHYRAILRHLADTDCGEVDLRILTNGVLMSREVWDDHRGLARYRPIVSVSVDAASAFTYGRVRPPGRWARLRPNLDFLAELRRAGTLRQFTLSMTIQADNYAEMAMVARLGRDLGCDHVRFNLIRPTGAHLAADFAERNVADPAHPEHQAFLWELRDPMLGDPVCLLFDVRVARDAALATEGETDDPLAAEVARRLREGETADGRAGEGAILLEMGRPWRAAQRYLRALEIDPAPARHLDAGIALFLAGLAADAAPHLEAGLACPLTDTERTQVESCLERARGASRNDRGESLGGALDACRTS